MPRTPEANHTIRAAQQSHILGAAREVFARRGWSATMADIAEAAGVSQGLAYRYFGGKEALYYALIEELRKPELVAPFLSEEKSPYERLCILVGMILDTEGDYIEFYRLLVTTLQDERVPIALRNAIQDYGGGFGELLRHLIQEGQAAGEIVDGDPEQLEIALRGCLNGLTKMTVNGQYIGREHFPTPNVVLRMIRK